MYEKDKNEYLNRVKKTARNSWIIGVFLVIMILILINFSSPSKDPMLPKKLDDRLLVQNRFKERLKHIDRVCAEENWKNDFDLRSHISQ